MKLLLDTHIALWSIGEPGRLPREARRLIETANASSVSVVTIWEIAIKHALRRGRHDDMILSGGMAHAQMLEAGFVMLSVTAEHAAAVDALPPLTGDPFDRMLVAQATYERARLLTHDARLESYGAPVLVV